MSRIGLPRADVEPVLRRMALRGDASPHAVAAQYGCSLNAIALLFAFVVDDDFVTMLASAARRPSSADMIQALHAASVRKPSSEEILLGFQLGRRRHTVYMDEALLDHDEVLFCIEPPFQWIATGPHLLRSELGAHTIAIPSR